MVLHLDIAKEPSPRNLFLSFVQNLNWFRRFLESVLSSLSHSQSVVKRLFRAGMEEKCETLECYRPYVSSVTLNHWTFVLRC